MRRCQWKQPSRAARQYISQVIVAPAQLRRSCHALANQSIYANHVCSAGRLNGEGALHEQLFETRMQLQAEGDLLLSYTCALDGSTLGISLTLDLEATGSGGNSVPMQHVFTNDSGAQLHTTLQPCLVAVRLVCGHLCGYKEHKRCRYMGFHVSHKVLTYIRNLTWIATSPSSCCHMASHTGSQRRSPRGSR